jgi:hypothetical protein
MRKCPKCSSQYNDDPKICRVCGAILEPIAEPANVGGAPVVPAEPRSDPQPPASASEWTCPACKSPVPASFEICWKCGADRSGVVVESVEPSAPEPDEPRESLCANDEEEPAPKAPSSCPRCGSRDIILDALVITDLGRGPDPKAYVAVDAHPEALVFKDRRYGRLVASICGQCGHIELRAENPQRLYEHWRRSQD